MKTAVPIMSTAEVREILQEIGYVLWLTRRLAAEAAQEKCSPVRPEMSEFCAVDIASCAA